MNRFYDTIYPALPIPAQNLLCTAAGYKRYRERFNARFRSRLSEWEETARAPLGQLHEIQRRRLVALLNRARAHVPYYRDLPPPDDHPDAAESIRRTLASIPPLEKGAYRDQPTAFLADDIPRRRRYRSWTSGTTGTALPIWYTLDTLAEEFASVWRMRRTCGVNLPSEPNITFNGQIVVPFDQLRPPFWRTNSYIGQTLFSVYHMTPENLREYVSAVHAAPARYVQGYPSAIHLVALTMLREGRPIPPGRLAAVFTSSESLLSFQRETIEEAFGARVRDRYGMSELGASMTQCEAGRLHVDMEFGIVEVECAEETDETVTGPLLITGLAQDATPLFRYRIGDVGTRSRRPCTCGRAGDVFVKVDGRVEDYVLTPDGRMIGRLDHAFKEQFDVAEAQVVQETEKAIEVLVVPRSSYTSSSESHLLRELRSRLGHKIEIRIRLVESIARERNGKFRAVKSKVGEARTMIRVGLARTAKSYAGLAPPYGPGKAYPELASLLADSASGDAPNPVYAGVRAALYGLGLDASHFGASNWNPLGDCVERGQRVVLKPNFIRHWNPTSGASTDCVITHGAIIRAVVDYAYLAVGTEGSVTIAEAPQHDCDFDRIREIAGLDHLIRFYEANLGRELAVIDLRREAVVYRDGIIVERRDLPGDPNGYRVVDLGDRSCFHGSGLDPDRMRGADYDPGPTAEHHRDGRNAYLLSETVLAADLVVNLPKLKTHKKTGVTLALKNLVGINGDKNWLPHHCAGPESQGGDEFPEGSWVDGTRSRAIDFARGLLARGVGVGFFRFARRVESSLRGDAFIRSGNWHGNRTTWRMCLDLNRCLYYSRPDGAALDATKAVRNVLTILDGVVAGEGDGPLAPTDRPLGVVLASLDPVALDLVAVALMGYDENAIPKIREAIRATAMRITAVRSAADVEVIEVEATSFERKPSSIEDVRSDAAFAAHPGWRGHLEHAICTP